MKTIWKFPIPIEDEFVIEMPVDAKITHVATQHGQPCLWAIVDANVPKEPKWFLLAGTGHPLPNEWLGFLGTFMVQNGDLVFHLFEVGDRLS